MAKVRGSGLALGHASIGEARINSEKPGRE